MPYKETSMKKIKDLSIIFSKFTFLNIGIPSSNKKYKPNCPNDFILPEKKITKENKKMNDRERFEIVLVNTVNAGITTIEL